MLATVQTPWFAPWLATWRGAGHQEQALFDQVSAYAILASARIDLGVQARRTTRISRMDDIKIEQRHSREIERLWREGVEDQHRPNAASSSVLNKCGCETGGFMATACA